MKNLKKNLILLFLTISFLLGILLRFWDLGKTPNSLDWDEVSWGYNAYSILKTGKDEHRNFLPLSFKAFGDYKQPMYVYADVLPIGIFGLNPFSVRFPSALAGSLSIILVFLLVTELFYKNKDKRAIAAIGAFLFAISPWSIQFSRVAFEANLGVFFVILGTWLFLRGLNKADNRLLFVSLMPIALSAYTYHSEKIFAPLIFLILIFFGYRFFNLKKSVVIGLCLAFFLLNAVWLVDSRTTERGRGVLFISHPLETIEKSFKDRIYSQEQGAFLGRVVHAPKVLFAEKYLENYLAHFNPNWLFFKGDSPRHHAPGFGLIYLVELPFILVGMYWLIKNKRRESVLLFLWFLTAPLASALSIDTPNASRAEIFLPMWQIFAALGLFYTLVAARNKKGFNLFLISVIVLFSFNFLKYIHQNFVMTNAYAQKDWQYGYKEAIEYSASNAKNKIVFSSEFEQPYIFYLFYTQYDPSSYIAEGGSARIAKECYSIGNAYFGNCLDKLEPDDIYLSLMPMNEEKFTKLKEIDYAFDDPAVYIYKVKQ